MDRQLTAQLQRVASLASRRSGLLQQRNSTLAHQFES
jgi:hypothetical protein